MRKIEKMMVEAVLAKKNFKLDNTTVEYRPAIESPIHSRMETSRVFLHGNHIATICHDLDGRIVVNKDTLSAYPTITTKSRLRALGVNVCTKKGVTYLDGEAI